MVSTVTTASAVPAPVSARLIAAQTATTAPLWATEPPTTPAAASGGELPERARVVPAAPGQTEVPLGMTRWTPASPGRDALPPR